MISLSILGSCLNAERIAMSKEIDNVCSSLEEVIEEIKEAGARAKFLFFIPRGAGFAFVIEFVFAHALSLQ